MLFLYFFLQKKNDNSYKYFLYSYKSQHQKLIISINIIRKLVA